MRAHGFEMNGYKALYICKLDLDKCAPHTLPCTSIHVQLHICHIYMWVLNNTPKFMCVGTDNGAMSMLGGQESNIFSHACHAFLSEGLYVKRYTRCIYKHKMSRNLYVN